MAKSKKTKQNQNSDHQKWELIFKALQKILQKQSLKLESLLQERDLLQQRIYWQRQSWSFDNNLFQLALSQVRRQLLIYELEKSCVIAKGEFQVSSKNRDSVLNKIKFEHTQCDLDDFKAWSDILSHKSPCKEVSSREVISELLNAKSGSHTSKNKPEHESKLDKEVSFLKLENEKHKADVFALQNKYNFVWNQLEEMERNYTNQLRTKNDEIDRANEKILNLVKSMEQLQSTGIEKEEILQTLITEISDVKAESSRKDGEICRLSKELEVIKSKTIEVSNEPSISGSKGKRRSSNRISRALEEDEGSRLSKELEVIKSKTIDVSNEPSISGSKGKTRSSNRTSRALEEDETLRAKISELQTKLNQKNEEISTLSHELRLLRSKSPNGTISGSRRGNVRGGKTISREDKVSFTELEAIITTQKVKISELEAEKSQKDGEISALSQKLKLQFESSSVTPSLKRCTNRPPSSKLRENRNGEECNGGDLREESSYGLISEQDCRRSKRKRDIISKEETPKLFTSQFKIPKLRSRSPYSR